MQLKQVNRSQAAAEVKAAAASGIPVAEGGVTAVAAADDVHMAGTVLGEAPLKTGDGASALGAVPLSPPELELPLMDWLLLSLLKPLLSLELMHGPAPLGCPLIGAPTAITAAPATIGISRV